MPRWVMTAAGVWEYPALGFRATGNSILIATAAPDDKWALNGDQNAPETVTRWTLGNVDPTDGGPPAQQAIVDLPDGGTPAETAYTLTVDGGTP